MYAISFVDELMPEHDFLLLAAPGGVAVFFREAAVNPQTLEDSWAAYRALCEQEPRPPTTQRSLSLISSA